MGHPIRMFGQHPLWFITVRNFQARRLMTPTRPLVREVSGGVLARAARMYGVKVHGYVFLSNHIHLIIGAQGPTISTFMQFLLSNLARKLSPLCRSRWWGRFWERRYSAAPILDAESAEARLRYLLSHGVKEGLVARPTEWEGLHCAEQLVDGKPRVFPWFDWTRRWRMPSAPSPYAAEIAEAETLDLVPLPHWQGRSTEERATWAAALVRAVEMEDGRASVLGMAAVKRQGTEIPPRRKRTPRPLCHAASLQAEREHRAAYFEFVRAYRWSSQRWRTGEVVEFPEGSFRPPSVEPRAAA